MGSVWIAAHAGLRTQVVVKFISEALASDPEIAARFSREAAAASLVKSPHVVHMIDYGVLPTGAFIAMELLDGHDLRQRLQFDGALPPRQVASLVSQVARALARAHERGVVHRDIKPGNIFLSDGGGGEAFIKVLDFGVAKIDDPRQVSHTQTGDALGTPYYMSPEQTVGAKSIDHRTDLWSLGVVAIEAMTGKPPFDGDTLGALALAICSDSLPVPSAIDSTLPVGVDAWFARACARAPGERFASAKELADAFETAVGGREAIPYEGATSMRFGQTLIDAGPDLALGEPTQPISPMVTLIGTSSPPGVSSTLGAVSESEPSTEPRRRRTHVVVGAAMGVAAIVGVVAIDASRSHAARAPRASAAAPEGAPASPPQPSANPPRATPSPSLAPPPAVTSASVVVAAVLPPSNPRITPASSAKRNVADAQPPVDPFGSGRR